MGKESACNTEDTGDVGLIPGSVKSAGEGNGYPLQYSCLENSVDRALSLEGCSPWGRKESRQCGGHRLGVFYPAALPHELVASGTGGWSCGHGGWPGVHPICGCALTLWPGAVVANPEPHPWLEEGPPHFSDLLSLILHARRLTCVCCAQSHPTLCDPRHCSLPGSSVHGVFQARIL